MSDRAEMGRALITTDVDLAVTRLRAGGLVALPTETVYGLAADATDPAAVDRIFAVKGRPRDHPLIVHLAEIEQLPSWAHRIPDAARILAEACWPGPLTVLLERSARVIDAVTGGRPTVGIRVPSHPATRVVLQKFGDGVAAPSANRFGSVSPTSAEHVLADIGDRLDPDRDLILDGGAAAVGIESTIVDCTVDPPQILRPGGIASEDIDRLLGRPSAPPDGPSRTSGMLLSHYAPDCRVVTADSVSDAEAIAASARASGADTRMWLAGDDLVAAAQRLYADLRLADRDQVDVLVAVLPAAVGLGHAIRDRLTKAATTTGSTGGAAIDRGRPSPAD